MDAEKEARVQVGIRELKNRLSEYVDRAKNGAEVTITDRGRPVAQLRPADRGPTAQIVARWVADGVVSWQGGKPRGRERPPRVRGGRAAAAVLENRR